MRRGALHPSSLKAETDHNQPDSARLSKANTDPNQVCLAGQAHPCQPFPRTALHPSFSSTDTALHIVPAHTDSVASDLCVASSAPISVVYSPQKYNTLRA